MISTSYCFLPCWLHSRLDSAVPWIYKAHLSQGLCPDGCPVWDAIPRDLFMAHSSTSFRFLLKCHLINQVLADYPDYLPLSPTVPFTMLCVCLLFFITTWQIMYLSIVCLPTLECKLHQSRDLCCLLLCSQCLEWYLENEADAR